VVKNFEPTAEMVEIEDTVWTAVRATTAAVEINLVNIMFVGESRRPIIDRKETCRRTIEPKFER